MQWPYATPCDRHGIMIKFSNCEEGKLSMVKLSRLLKSTKTAKVFPLECFDVYGTLHDMVWSALADY